MAQNIQLSSDQLAVIGACIEAIVNKDPQRLNELVEGDHDIYTWTRDYGRHDQVDLVFPEDEPATWHIEAIDVTTERPTIFAAIPMWTKQEGRSDLTLEVTLALEPDGHWSARIHDLHVL
jgi:hypothetical protein